MSNNVICRGGRASTLAPLLPRFVTTKPAFESLESDFRTNVGSAFTLSARVTEDISSPWWNPSAAMMCAATENWTLFTDITSPAGICDAQQHNWLHILQPICLTSESSCTRAASHSYNVKAWGSGLVARRANILGRLQKCCKSPSIYGVGCSRSIARRAN